MNFSDVLVTILNGSIIFATPLILAALGGVFSERSGVVNIALEGLMVIGAFAAAVVTIFVGESLGVPGWLAPWIGMLAAMVAGIIFSLPHAVASIDFKADQVVSGVALNFLAAGFALFLVKKLFEGAGQTTTVQNVFTKIAIPGLYEIPVIGPGIFNVYGISYLAMILVGVSYYVLYKTPFGLRLRAVGEHPRAADTLGVNVRRMRYMAVMISGALAGLGGSALSIAISSNFQHATVSGHGFMALAAMIFGKWHPAGAMGAALFFGLATALSVSGQVLGLTEYVPSEFLNALPYLLTILALAGVVGRSEAPAANGKPYETGSR
ncbi:sugar ABC transporter permease [Tumebacillus algifaecis]|uniref:Sugar ABC transporter permease n=1 Tax=Tumebacillus algifaecis TaxID=1214604 RepID=A0A223D1W4_9BACL|nr:ABC transporter permease [Tumebacillus algifaecis]ASS75582.1 sugar ABC transporter permease [Tumebacillus algifaecis]